MNIEKERKRIEDLSTGNGCIGHITLDKLAIPETVKVTLLGENINPDSFDCYGHPNFTEEQRMIYRFYEEEVKRASGKNKNLYAEVVYQEKIFEVPRNVFDTVLGIQNNLTTMGDLNELLNNRRLFCKAHKEVRLNEFVIFGCVLLDQFGQVMSIDKVANGKLISTGDVEEFETFKRNNNNGFTLTSSGFTIPNGHVVCPCCGKLITIDDIKNNPCICIKGKFYHKVCYQNYRLMNQVDKFTRGIMDFVYAYGEYRYELLSDSFRSPELKFHTIDGDIVMKLRKNVISIEWQENYKSFDMKIFDTEDVTKWQGVRRRGIYALGSDKAYEYLKKVRDAVHPSVL